MATEELLNLIFFLFYQAKSSGFFTGTVVLIYQPPGYY